MPILSKFYYLYNLYKKLKRWVLQKNIKIKKIIYQKTSLLFIL